MKNFYVLTGGPGSGKTSVLELLKEKECLVVNEVARDIIREEMASGGVGLPWKDIPYYTSLMLERSVLSYQDTCKREGLFFFDRGIPDTLAYSHLTGLGDKEAIEQACRQYLYNDTVFVFPPWKEIYRMDEERKQDWEEAVLTYDTICRTYLDLGYTCIELPRCPVEERAEFILEFIA